MRRAKLTNGAVEKFQCREGKAQDILWCGETSGFGMRLSRKTGARTYILLYRVKGTRRERYITIGRHNDPWRVDQARARAIKLKAQMLDGIDPVEQEQERQEEKRRQQVLDSALSTTLRAVMEHYLLHKRTQHGQLRPRTQKDIRSHCDNNLSSWLDQPVASITRDRCLAKFTEISKRAPGQANLCMVYLRALLNHAREMHATDDGEYPLLAVNPVSRMFKLKKPNPERPRDTRIPLDRLGACWNWLRSRAADGRETERTAADWLCFVLLTGCRRNESGSLRWADVDLDSKTLTLRGEVTKNHMPLTLPMSTVMHELLSARKSPAPLDAKVERRRTRARAAEYVFASNGKKTPYIGNAQATLEGLSKVAGTHVHLHSLRRTFDDVAMECRIDSDVRRMLLNHISGDVHARHYSNSTRALVPAVEAIAKWIVGEAEQAAAVEKGENVIELQRKQKAVG